MVLEDIEGEDNASMMQYPFMLALGGILTVRRMHLRGQYNTDLDYFLYTDSGAVLVVEDSVIEDSGEPAYGVRGSYGGQVTLRRCIIRNIQSKQYFIYLSDRPKNQLLFVDTLFEDISVTDGDFFSGLYGIKATFENSTFRRINRRTYGGRELPFEVKNCTFEGYTHGALLLRASSSIQDTIFRDNSNGPGDHMSALGWAPYDGNRVLTIARTRFERNTAQSFGAGLRVYSDFDNPIIWGDGVVFENNTAPKGAAIFVGVNLGRFPPSVDVPSRVEFLNNIATMDGITQKASDLKALLVDIGPQKLLSGDTLKDFSVKPVDIFGQPFYPFIYEPLFLRLTSSDADLFGSLTQARTEDLIMFQEITVVASPGLHNISLVPQQSGSAYILYTPAFYTVTFQVEILPCPADREEVYRQSSKYLSCVVPACTKGCTKNGRWIIFATVNQALTASIALFPSQQAGRPLRQIGCQSLHDGQCI
ncbi:hypothetical protein DFS34DRAFT_617881 [Phlyctochytrium arcticum]|nr:hypothetical protein DFS34DRAFT_617881 [Phlyctochytrium arcticum]